MSRKPLCISPTCNKVYFISLGCPRNLVDTEVMIGLLKNHGHEPISDLEKADFIVINTCGFLEKSRKETIDTIHETLSNKKKSAKVIVTGCMVHIQKERLEKECPGIHFFLGSGDIGSILHAFKSTKEGSHISQEKSFLEAGDVPRVLSTPANYAYLKIAEGCRKRCSYCIIPSIKGKLKSKSIDQILLELRTLVKKNVREIILIAQDLGDWGKDIEGRPQLVDLLQHMVQVEGNFRLRLLYLYPDEITEELIECIKNNPKIIPYLDMPIQHINDEILKKMHRSTSKKQILEILKLLRKKIPHITIRTSLIVGFPGETEEQFEELSEFVRKEKIDHVGIFEYSKEEMSSSASLPGHISEETKKERLEKLASIQKKISLQKNKKLIGKSLPVVVEGFHPESRHLMVGRHDGQCPEVDGIVIINDCRKVDAFNQRYSVEITDAFEYDLVGKVLGKSI